MILFIFLILTILLILLGVVVAFAFNDKAGTGELNEKDSANYSLENIETKNKNK